MSTKTNPYHTTVEYYEFTMDTDPKTTSMPTQTDDCSTVVEYHECTADAHSPSASLFHWGVVLIFLMMIILLSGEAFKVNANQWAMESVEVAFPDTDTPIVSTILPTPKTSVITAQYNPASATCPLTIKARDKHCYFKVYDLKNGGKIVAQFFIRSNEKLKTSLPTGIYMLKYISGSQWYGQEDMFGLFGNERKINPLNLGNDHSCKHEQVVAL